MKKKEKENYISVRNFNPSNYVIDNSFFIPLTNYKAFIKNIDPQKDLINGSELITVLENKLNKVSEIISNQSSENSINIAKEFYSAFISLKELKKANSNISKNISQIISNYSGKRLTLKLIAEEYEKTHNRRLSLMTLSRVMRYHLDFHYRKTSIKNPKLLEECSILMAFCFLRTIIRSMELGLNIVYLDEVGFTLDNKNFYTWKKKDDFFYGGAKNNQKTKLNIILSIDENQILYGKFLNKNIDSDDFIQYMDEFFERINEEERKNMLVVMDNAKFHVSRKVKNYFENKNIKVITTVPYLSTFNSIELLFRSFKNITYKENFKNMKELKKKVFDLINDKKMDIIVKKNFAETLNKYKEYFNKYKSFKNLNEIRNSILKKKRKRK